MCPEDSTGGCLSRWSVVAAVYVHNSWIDRDRPDFARAQVAPCGAGRGFVDARRAEERCAEIRQSLMARIADSLGEWRQRVWRPGVPHRLAACALVAAAFLMGGCATLSREQCLSGDWYQIGLDDGQRGVPDWRLARHVRTCRRYGVQLDREVYLAGRAEGLKTFCTEEGGYRFGLAGGDDTAVCPPERTQAFRKGYDKGRAEYLYQRSLEQEEYWMGHGSIFRELQRHPGSDVPR